MILTIVPGKVLSFRECGENNIQAEGNVGVDRSGLFFSSWSLNSPWGV